MQRWRLGSCGIALLVACALLVPSSAAHSATLPGNCVATGVTVQCTFAYNGTNGSDGSAQSFVVPAGVTRVTIETWGAQGGGAAGGLGGHARGTVTVTPAETLTVRVAGQPSGAFVGLGGFNGGGSGNFGGGGASDVREGDALASRVVVAGGGGGVGCSGPPLLCTAPGGAGGGLSGGDGDSLNTGGTQTGGGSGGLASCAFGGSDGSDGSAGVGGNGGSCQVPQPHMPPFVLSAAGGGGGLFGGGGGGVAFTITPVSAETGSGAGGSGFVIASAASALNEAGVRAGNGLVTISYLRTPPSKDACKNGGWHNSVDDQGQPFANQGQCVSWTEHHL